MKPPTKLRLVRIQAGLTQYEVEKLTGIFQPILSQYELELRQPKEQHRQALAKLYGITEEVLFSKVEDCYGEVD